MLPGGDSFASQRHYARHMTRRALAVDAGIAAVAFGLTVAMLHARGLGTPDPGTRPGDGLSVLLAMASTLPLVARRTAPLAVFAVTGAATLVLLALEYGMEAPFGAVVAAYTAAEAYGGGNRSGRRRVVLFGNAGFVLAAISSVIVTDGFEPGLMVPGLLVWVLLFAGAWVAGERAQLRRERFAELEERARWTEREAERERRVAAAEERIRIARELHDSAGHALNVILVQAGAARLLHQRNPATSQQAIATIEELAGSTIGEIDRLVRALRKGGSDPPPADLAEIDELVQRHRAGGLVVRTEVHGSPDGLPLSVAWARYRILQESPTNAARHGRGSADVTVQYGRDAVEITVTNPTPAGPSRPASSGGHGIVGMRERTNLLGGSLQTGNGPGGKFRVHARLPRAESEAGA
jgi:signal transduction histidine kinase